MSLFRTPVRDKLRTTDSNKRLAPDTFRNTWNKRTRLFGLYTPKTDLSQEDLFAQANSAVVNNRVMQRSGTSLPQSLTTPLRIPTMNLLCLEFSQLTISAPYNFTLFSKLPTELRLKIWRMAFPGSRHVGIDSGCGCFSSPGGPCNFKNPHWRIELPITLRISRESRSETLRDYCLYYPQDLVPVHRDYQSPCMLRPFCFNPSIDTAYITLAKSQIGGFWFHFWMEELASKDPKILSSIRSLEVRNADGDGDWTWHYFRDRFISSKNGKRHFKSLLHLPSLKDICFTSCPPLAVENGEVIRVWVQIRATREAGSQVQFKKDAEAWYEKKREYLTMGKIPEIMIRPWAEIKDRPYERNGE